MYSSLCESDSGARIPLRNIILSEKSSLEVITTPELFFCRLRSQSKQASTLHTRATALHVPWGAVRCNEFKVKKERAIRRDKQLFLRGDTDVEMPRKTVESLALAV